MSKAAQIRKGVEEQLNVSIDANRPEPKTLFERLARAREDFHKMLKTGQVVKSGENKHLGSKYFELGDIVPPALQCLHRYGLCTMPMSVNGISCTMAVVESETGTTHEFSIPLEKSNIKGHPVQALGASLTYSRRYLWLQCMEAVEPDIVEQVEPAEKHSPKDPATEAQMDTLRDAYKSGRLSDEAAKTLKSASDSGKSITIEQASALIAGLSLDTEARIKNQGAKA